MATLTLVGAGTSKTTDVPDLKAKTREAARVLGELAEMLPDDDHLKRPMSALSLCLDARLRWGKGVL